MSHRKFSAPRHGSLQYLPKKRCRRKRGRIRAFPKDDPSLPCHLTGFLAFKAGCTHIVRGVKRPGSRLHNKEAVEQVTVLEAPPLVACGLVGYMETPTGLRSVTSVFAQHIDDDVKRRFYKNWSQSKKNAFKNYQKQFQEQGEAFIKEKLDLIKKRCQIVRLICHTKNRKVNINQKRSFLIEIQVNGGSIGEKVAFGFNLFEKDIPVGTVFEENEMLDAVSITKGKGYQGVIKRWKVTKLPRKSHRGARKVACIGSWHPARIQYSIARRGQMGFHHRTEINLKCYRLGKAARNCPEGNASTEMDPTPKHITPLGGFPHYGEVSEDFVMLKGACPGTRRRPVALRKSLIPQISRSAEEKVELKFIDTSSKMGAGRFQTQQERDEFYGIQAKRTKV